MKTVKIIGDNKPVTNKRPHKEARGDRSDRVYLRMHWNFGSDFFHEP